MVQALGEGYRRAGHDFALVVPGRRAGVDEASWGRLVHLPAPRVPASGGSRARIDTRGVSALLEDLQPDRLEVSDRFTLRPLGAWARRAGVPSLVFAHERIDGVLRAHLRIPAPLAVAFADRVNRQTAARFDHVAVTTRFAAEEFSRIGAPTVHVPLGVDLDQFRPSHHRQQRASGSFMLVLCSRLSREKRPDVAVEALRALHMRGNRARLVVAGDGPMAGRLRRRSEGLPVEFLGHVATREGLVQLLSQADVVLAPGPIETFGLAALEALACGTPVVVADTSALTELVRPPGGRCAPPDPAAFADAILDLLADPVTARRAAARHRAEQFPWSRTTSEVLALHERHASAVPVR